MEMTQDKFVKEFIAPLRKEYSRPLPFTNIDPSSDNAQTFIYCMTIHKRGNFKKCVQHTVPYTVHKGA
jgi:hypothetical protein